MQRYFVNDEQWFDYSVEIKGADYHHIANVMRMKPGKEVICNHPTGVSYLCKIDIITDQTVQLQIIEKLTEQVELPIKVTLSQGLTKGDKLDWIVQKATELGVNKIIPLDCSRSVVKWDQKKQAKKVQRLEKIAKEAAEQSHRTTQPMIETIHSVTQLMEIEQNFDHKFIAYEETTRKVETRRLNQYLERIAPGESISIVIGPEGGLTKDEIDILYDRGYQPIRLGPRILRTETASLYFLSVLSYAFEETE